MTAPLAWAELHRSSAELHRSSGALRASLARAGAFACHRRAPVSARSRRAGFTLIEMIAVVAIFALLVAVVAPNLGRLSGRTLREAADDLAARLELARERAVVTGIRHRVWIDLDAATYRLEWVAREGGEVARPEPAQATELDLSGDAPLPLAAPRDKTLAFRPLPGHVGRDEALASSLSFRGVETPGGYAERGEVAIEFAPDGTADATTLILDDDSGHGVLIDVLPLAEAVRVSDAQG